MKIWLRMQLSAVFTSLLATSESLAGTVLRLALGIMILPHGLQKTIGAPWIFALLAILAESVGGIMLIAGAGTRLAALGVGGVMLVAATQHRANGFFMNWTGQQKGEGIEFHLLALGIVVALLILGGGRFSVDSMIKR